MNAAPPFSLPLSITKLKLRGVPFVQAAEKWWMQLLQLGQLIGDWKLQLYAQDQSYFARTVLVSYLFQKTRAKLLLFEIIVCFSLFFQSLPTITQRWVPEVKTTKLSWKLVLTAERDTVQALTRINFSDLGCQAHVMGPVLFARRRGR